MRKRSVALLMVAGVAILLFRPVGAEELLSGDIRLACEAILCLSSGVRPSACMPALERYFSISLRWWSDTVRARFDFLQLCPTSQQSPEMLSLVNAMANGAGRCEVSSLNGMLSWSTNDDCYSCPVYISDQLPNYCGVYFRHPFTNFAATAPRYVGTPWRGGYWVEARDYERLLAEYQARIKAEDDAQAAEAARVNERNMW